MQAICPPEIMFIATPKIQDWAPRYNLLGAACNTCHPLQNNSGRSSLRKSASVATIRQSRQLGQPQPEIDEQKADKNNHHKNNNPAYPCADDGLHKASNGSYSPVCNSRVYVDVDVAGIETHAQDGLDVELGQVDATALTTGYDVAAQAHADYRHSQSSLSLRQALNLLKVEVSFRSHVLDHNHRIIRFGKNYTEKFINEGLTTLIACISLVVDIVHKHRAVPVAD
jgi:hypothetical protein